MRRIRQGTRPRRTRSGTAREGNDAGVDAAALECRDLPGMAPWMPAACGARRKVRRAEPAASGRKIASVAARNPPASR